MTREEINAINVGFARMCLAIINRAFMDASLAARNQAHHAHSARAFLREDNEFYQMYLAMVEACAPDLNPEIKEKKRESDFADD